MASDQSRLGPLALAVLTLLCQSQGSIHVLRVSAGGRQPLVQRLARAQQRCPRFRVVDVGAAMNPWTLKVLNAVVDRTPQVVEDCFQQPWFSAAAARFCCRSGPHTWLQANNVTCFTKDFDFERCCRNGEPHQLLHFAMDVNKESAWDPLLHHVEVAGKFEFAVASHILEDIVNPEILLQMLPRIARRGFVAMPSKFTELKRGVDAWIYHTCAAGEPPLGSAARSASCQEAASLVRRRNASAVMSACMQETPSGLPGHEAATRGPEGIAAAVRKGRRTGQAWPKDTDAPEENSIPMELGLDCLASSPLKTSFYNDLGRLFARLPWISLRHPLPYYDRSTFLDFAQSLPTWVSWLFELWYFYDNIFLPMFREQQAWGSYLAPLFRLPPWAVPRGTDRRQRVVENLIQMLAERRAPTKVAMAEVGVFMGDTSASVLTKRLPVSTVHLVDPWDTNEIFQAVAQEKRQEITGAEARKHVEQRFGGLGTVHCFDGPAGAHRPYQGEALAPERRWSHTCGEVGIHAAASVDASRRIVAASLDLVFVDGAHDYESVLQDMNMKSAIFGPGGERRMSHGRHSRIRWRYAMCLRRARVLLLYLALCLVARPCRGPRSVSPVTFAMPRSRCSIFRRVRPFGRAVAVHRRTEPAAVPEKAVAALAPEGMTVKDGAAIIAGTALGGGFLALPSVTAPMGIMPSLVGLVVVWIFLVAVGTVYAEAAAYTLQGKQGDAETPSDSSVIEDEGVSVVSVAQRALGDPAAVTCSAAFALQMLAVVTAQVAKCGELLSALTGLPYYVGCILPSAGLGFFVFQSPSRTVEQTNTYLAAAMVAGFMLLILSTVASVDLSNPAGVFGSLPASNWSLLVPAVGTTTWALPIFFNLLCFGQSIPLVVERIGPQKTNKIRSAILLGSGVPLVMGMVWVPWRMANPGDAPSIQRGPRQKKTKRN
ncbi:unnamed protein product [Effrenium voratum]|nr:unnamed protein product [Effrenium voratum]